MNRRWVVGLALLGAVGMGRTAAAGGPAPWVQASSPHFVVYAQDTPEAVRAFTDKLERFDAALRTLRRVGDPAISPLARVTVFEVRNIGAVQKLAGRGLGDVAGFYEPRASDSVAFVPRVNPGDNLTPFEILLHEYSHHFMFLTWGETPFPAWLVEAFAEFNATAAIKDDSVTFGAPPLYRAYGMLANEVVPLKTLLTANPNTLSDLGRQVFYGRAWLLLDYMTVDEGRRRKLGDYMTAVSKGEPADKAAALLGDPRVLDDQLNAYAHQRSLTVFSVKPSAPHAPVIEIRPLTAAEAAVMPALITSKRGVNEKTAPPVAAQARALAAPFPTDPAAQNVLAEADYDAQDYAGAQAAADRALAADPKSVHALIYAGLSRAAQLRAAKSTDVAAWTAVRGWYSRANHLDPEYAWPMVLYYAAYAQGGAMPTANAQAGLLYAHTLAPYDGGLGMTAAYVLLKQGKPSEATAMLKPIAYDPHGGGRALAATALIDAIGKGGAAAALAMMEGTDKTTDDASASGPAAAH